MCAMASVYLSNSIIDQVVGMNVNPRVHMSTFHNLLVYFSSFTGVRVMESLPTTVCLCDVLCYRVEIMSYIGVIQIVCLI